MSATRLTKGMHVKEAKDSAGILSFLGGKRDITVCAEKSESIFSNMGSAIRFTVLLSMLLWWIPIVGQACAGYVGGRKAGTPARGMVATMVSILLLVAIMMVVGMGIIGGLDFLSVEPEELVAAVGMDFPLLGTLLALILAYIQAFFGSIGLTTSLKLNIYMITVVFGLIGGAIAEQHSREVARVTPDAGVKTFIPRSLAAYNKGKKLGFEDLDSKFVRRPEAAPCAQPVRDVAREIPAAADTVREQRANPFAGLIHRAEKSDPGIRHRSSKEDMEYV